MLSLHLLENIHSKILEGDFQVPEAVDFIAVEVLHFDAVVDFFLVLDYLEFEVLGLLFVELILPAVVSFQLFDLVDVLLGLLVVEADSVLLGDQFLLVVVGFVQSPLSFLDEFVDFFRVVLIFL